MGAAQCGLEEHKKIRVRAAGAGKREDTLALAKVYSWFFAGARGLLNISFFLY
jgi:hypothetical protein